MQKILQEWKIESYVKKRERGTDMEIQKNNKNVFVEIACSIFIVIISVAIGWKNVSDDKKERAEYNKVLV